METDVKISYSKSNNKYYTNSVVLCGICNKKIEGVMMLEILFSKKNHIKNNYCLGCLKKRNKYKTHLWTELFGVIITKFIPSDAIPIISWLPEVSVRNNLSVYAIDKIQEGKTINRTRYARQQSIENATIGDKTNIDDGLDRKLNIKKTIEHLDRIKLWKPIDNTKKKIGYEGVKKISKGV